MAVVYLQVLQLQAAREKLCASPPSGRVAKAQALTLAEAQFLMDVLDGALALAAALQRDVDDEGKRADELQRELDEAQDFLTDNGVERSADMRDLQPHSLLERLRMLVAARDAKGGI